VRGCSSPAIARPLVAGLSRGMVREHLRRAALRVAIMARDHGRPGRPNALLRLKSACGKPLQSAVSGETSPKVRHLFA
jgi:hypothetical protein